MPLCGTDEASAIKLDDTIGKPWIETMPLQETDEALDIALDDANGEPYIEVIPLCKAGQVLYVVPGDASTLKTFLPCTLSHGTSPIGIVVPSDPPPELPPMSP